DYQSILEEARASDRMLFVTLTDESSSAWQKMKDEDVLEDPSLAQVLSAYQPVLISVNSDMGTRWTQLFIADTIPSFYFLHNDELLLGVVKGHQTPAR